MTLKDERDIVRLNRWQMGKNDRERGNDPQPPDLQSLDYLDGYYSENSEYPVWLTSVRAARLRRLMPDFFSHK